MNENTRLRKTIWRFIRPRAEEMTLNTVIALIIFVTALYSTAISGQVNLDTQELFRMLEEAIANIIRTITVSIGGNRLLLFGLWFLVGAGVYIMLWFIANILIDMYNNIVVSAAFVHPQSFHQSEYWVAIAARTVLRVIAALALVSYLYFWVVILLPGWAYAYRLSLTGLTGGSLLNGLVTTVFIITTLHVCTILYRIVTLKKSEDELE